MVIAHADGKTLALDPGVRRAEGRLVGGGGVVPQAELEKDVGGHVQRVARLRRDPRRQRRAAGRASRACSGSS